jgi:hypothetical protein
LKAIILDSIKWNDETDIAIHWLNYTVYNQSNIITYIRQLDFDILELTNHGKGGFDFFGQHYDREIVYEFNSSYYVKEYS